MILAVDEAIPYWQQAFSTLGEIRTFSGRKVRPTDIKEADALVVRSVTRVDASLLEGSSVRFVGTATIGTDHLDETYLQARRIRFANAAGSNANSVAEYVTAALLVMAQRKGWDLSRKTIAIVGVGHVGSRVLEKVRALGMQSLLCDPPLRESTGDQRYQFLSDVLGADILTFHVPLTRDGPYPTYHMVNRALLEGLSPSQYLINTARGAVFDCGALKARLESRKLDGAVLDVWEGEPKIDYSLLDLVDIGSPHIAGYSLDGKVRGTEMIAEELCRFFNIPFRWDSQSIYPRPLRLRSASGAQGQDALRSIVLQAYDILREDTELRALKSLPGEDARAGFDRLRNEYPLRPEFRHYIAEPADSQSAQIPKLKGLGFQVALPDQQLKSI
jgi:erythronate-4-phosphate dehydrogenase